MENLIICAGNGENFSFAKAVGVGLVNSAINLTSLLKNAEISSNLPQKIIFIATAGLYKSGEILEIYESSLASNLEISSLLNLAYTPMNSDFKANVSYETLKKYSPKFTHKDENYFANFVVNSSNFITINKKIAHKFYEKGCFLENMEFYSILKVADFFKIPAVGIFCATNFCDKFAHQDFLQNHKEAKFKLERYISEKGLI